MNKDILKSRWSGVDTLLDTHLTKYKKINKSLQDELQDVFNGIKWEFSEANSYITASQKQKLGRLYENWSSEGILSDITAFKITNMLNKKNITNLEVLTVTIEALYSRQSNRLNEKELFEKIAKSSYDLGCKECEGKIKRTKNAIALYIATLLALPNETNGNIWGEYIDSMNNYNASQIKNQVLINLQQGKEMNISDFEFQKILISQQKRYLNKKKGFDKFSGALDNETAYIVNNSLLQSYLDNNIKKVRFISIIDNKTTEMCRSLNDQTFWINKMNKFTRYSDLNSSLIEYNFKGLKCGINLPPIVDNFHYCRSTIYREN